MKFLLILFIVVLLIQIIKYLSTKENFDNNCFYNFKPDFTLKISDYFETDTNGNLSLDRSGNVQYDYADVLISNEYKSDISDNLYQDISTILQPTFNNVLLDKTNCKLDY